MHEQVLRAPRAGDIGPIRREIIFEPLPEPTRPIERPPAEPVRPPEPAPTSS
jgi:hypothetical protein